MAAIEWFRLWHDMPNDPKWRTVARASGQPISLVLSVALHLMVDASRNVTRGHVTVTVEDVASALDVTDEAIDAIFKAMQGRVLDGDRLSGWEKRQPKREDAGNPETGVKSATERKQAQRQRERVAGGDAGHGTSRNVTLDKDTDTDKDSSVFPGGNTGGAGAPAPSTPGHDGKGLPAEPGGADGAAATGTAADGGQGGDKLPRALGVRELVAEGVERRHAEDWLKARAAKRAPLTPTAWDDVKAEAAKAGISPGEAVRMAAKKSWQGFRASWYAKLGQEEKAAHLQGVPGVGNGNRHAGAAAAIFDGAEHV